MASFDNFKGQRIVELRAAVAVFNRQIGQRRTDVELSQSFGGAGNVIGNGNNVANHIVKQFKLHCQRLFGSAADAVFKLSQFNRGKAGGIQHRLTVNKVFVLQHFGGKFALNLNKIADNIVVFDFQIGNVDRLGIFVLQFKNQFMAVFLQFLNGIERRIIAGADKAAVTRQQRQFFIKRLIQRFDQIS